MPARADDAPDSKLRTTVEVSSKAMVHTARVSRDVAAGRIAATKYGRDLLFTEEQFREAIAYYRREEKERRGAARTRRAAQTDRERDDE